MRRPIRNESGFSLPTVIALGVVASLWMLGTASLVVPATAKLTSERVSDMARCSAEAGLDYALAQINNPNTRSTMLAATSYSIPSTIMADYSTSKTPATNFTGTISINNVRPPSSTDPSPYTKGYTSYLWDPNVDDQVSGTQFYNNGASNNYWRVLTANVTNGIVSRAVRVILKPSLNTTTVYNQVQVPGTPIPIFQFTAFGVGSVGGNGNTSVNSYNSSTNPHPTTFDTLTSTKNKPGTVGYGDLATNGSASLTGNGVIGGNLDLYGSNNTASGGPNVTVDGQIQATNPTGSFASNPNAVTSPTTPQSLPSVPPQPSSPTPLPGGGSSINLSGKSSMTLTAGNYVVSSITIQGNASLNIDSSAGPVNIWVQGNSSTGVNIGGNGVSNASGIPSNLRIWYSGSQNVQVAGNGGFTGVVFAPNAPVTYSGNADAYGAAVGNTVNLNGNGSFHYDRALMNNSTLMWTPMVTQSQAVTTIVLQDFQAVSWHEFNPNSPY